jgi:tetratricopeptide (TPR) repeat protein
MKLLKSSFTVLLLGLFVLGVISDIQAQDRRSVVKTYNKGIELKQSAEFEQAINTFNQTITNAEELGGEGEDLVDRAKQQLVDTYYKKAVSQYKELQKNQSLQNFDAAIAAFNDAREVAEDHENAKVQEKVSQIIPQLYYNKGLFAYRGNSNEDALEALNKAVEENPNYANAYYQIAIVKKNTDGVEQSEVISAFEQALEIGQETNNSSVINESNKQLGGIYLSQGHSLVNEQQQTDEGIEAYQQALKYTPEDPQIFFRLAEAYNKSQEWEQAREYAEKGLNLESGGRTDQAKYYFELGNAYKGLGQTEEACSAFGNAAYGSFKSPAEHAMEYQLECEENASN